MGVVVEPQFVIDDGENLTPLRVTARAEVPASGWAEFAAENFAAAIAEVQAKVDSEHVAVDAEDVTDDLTVDEAVSAGDVPGDGDVGEAGADAP